MASRGEYSAIYTAIVDDLDYQALSPAAKLCALTLKLILGPSGIDVVRCFEQQMMEVTGLTEDELLPALDELIERDWLRCQANVVWLKNGLKHNPNLSLNNEKHRKSVVNHIAGLPKLEIANAFAMHYQIPEPWPGMGSEWVSVPYGKQVHGKRYTVEVTSSSLRSEDEPERPVLVDDSGKVNRKAFLATVCPLIRSNVWQDKRPPAAILLEYPNWDEGREANIVMQWITEGTATVDEALVFLERFRANSSIRDGPTSLLWLNSAENRIRLYEAIHEVRKAMGQPKEKGGSGPVMLGDIFAGVKDAA